MEATAGVRRYSELQAIIDDCKEDDATGVVTLTEFATEQVELFSRRMFVWCTRCFNCARSSNAVGLRISQSFHKRPRDVALQSRSTMRRTRQSDRSPSTTPRLPRSDGVFLIMSIHHEHCTWGNKHLRMSYWYRLQAYHEASSRHRTEMHPDEQDCLLICARKCGPLSAQEPRNWLYVVARVVCTIP
jgi:hypothetical protein